jgi:vacuolar-type H+-ATPase subunit F/Vma7
MSAHDAPRVDAGGAVSHVLRVLCRPALCDGFALAGVPSLPANDAVEATHLLERLAETPQVGVVLVEESLFDALPDELRRRLERRPLPVVIPFPGPRREEAPDAAARLVELLRRAIGYRVRLR